MSTLELRTAVQRSTEAWRDPRTKLADRGDDEVMAALVASLNKSLRITAAAAAPPGDEDDSEYRSAEDGNDLFAPAAFSPLRVTPAATPSPTAGTAPAKKLRVRVVAPEATVVVAGGGAVATPAPGIRGGSAAVCVLQNRIASLPDLEAQLRAAGVNVPVLDREAGLNAVAGARAVLFAALYTARLETVDLDKDLLARVKARGATWWPFAVLAITPGEPSSSVRVDRLSTGDRVIMLYYTAASGKLNDAANQAAYEELRRLIRSTGAAAAAPTPAAAAPTPAADAPPVPVAGGDSLDSDESAPLDADAGAAAAANDSFDEVDILSARGSDFDSDGSDYVPVRDQRGSGSGTESEEGEEEEEQLNKAAVPPAMQLKRWAESQIAIILEPFKSSTTARNKTKLQLSYAALDEVVTEYENSSPKDTKADLNEFWAPLVLLIANKLITGREADVEFGAIDAAFVPVAASKVADIYTHSDPVLEARFPAVPPAQSGAGVITRLIACDTGVVPFYCYDDLETGNDENPLLRVLYNEDNSTDMFARMYPTFPATPKLGLLPTEWKKMLAKQDANQDVMRVAALAAFDNAPYDSAMDFARDVWTGFTNFKRANDKYFSKDTTTDEDATLFVRAFFFARVPLEGLFTPEFAARYRGAIYEFADGTQFITPFNVFGVRPRVLRADGAAETVKSHTKLPASLSKAIRANDGEALSEALHNASAAHAEAALHKAVSKDRTALLVHFGALSMLRDNVLPPRVWERAARRATSAATAAAVRQLAADIHDPLHADAARALHAVNNNVSQNKEGEEQQEEGQTEFSNNVLRPIAASLANAGTTEPQHSVALATAARWYTSNKQHADAAHNEQLDALRASTSKRFGASGSAAKQFRALAALHARACQQ